VVVVVVMVVVVVVILVVVVVVVLVLVVVVVVVLQPLAAPLPACPCSRERCEAGIPWGPQGCCGPLPASGGVSQSTRQGPGGPK